MGTGHAVKFTYIRPQKGYEINSDEFYIISVQNDIKLNVRDVSDGYSRDIFILKAVCFKGNKGILVSDGEEKVNVKIGFIANNKTGYIQIID